jgi:putative flippase GtrA
MISLARQFSSFVGVGIMAAIVHYGCLIGLVEGAGAAPVGAALTGYVMGGLVSYGLNRRHTFGSERPHREAVWRFALVAGVGFVLTYAFMAVLTGGLRLPYLLAQLATTGVVMLWSFAANRLWTFRFER